MEIITRAVAINDGRILAARQRNRPWSFLPGGHVEPGEAIQAALARELVEELSAEAQIGRLIGVVEHAYAEDGTDTTNSTWSSRSPCPPAKSPAAKTTSISPGSP